MIWPAVQDSSSIRVLYVKKEWFRVSSEWFRVLTVDTANRSWPSFYSLVAFQVKVFFLLRPRTFQCTQFSVHKQVACWLTTPFLTSKAWSSIPLSSTYGNTQLYMDICMCVYVHPHAIVHLYFHNGTHFASISTFSQVLNYKLITLALKVLNL